MRFFLDNNVPDSVGRTLREAGHVVIFQRDVIARDAPDGIVALASAENDAILITFDKDFKGIASRFNVSNKRLRNLSKIGFRCKEPEAASRIKEAMSLIEFEWTLSKSKSDNRLFMEIQPNAFKTIR